MTNAEHDLKLRPWLSHYPKRISPTMNYPVAPLHKFLQDSASKFPNRTALVFFGRSTSYATLLEEVKLIAGWLKSKGLNKGDRVGIMLPNCPQLVAAYYGALWAGATAVMINPTYTPRELNFLLKDSGCRYLFALDLVHSRVAEAKQDTHLEKVKVIVTGIQDALPFPLASLYSLRLIAKNERPKIPRNAETLRFSDVLKSKPLEEPSPTDPRNDLAVLQYTAGTTGTPKGAMLTHSNLVSNCMQVDAWYPKMEQQQVTILGAIPFFHVYGMTTIMNFGILVGARMVLLPRFEIVQVLKTIQEYKPQLFPGVPTMYVALNNYPGVKDYSLRSIEWCISGAAPLPMEVKETFEKISGGHVLEGYGLSEASPVTHANPIGGLQKAGSIGIPFPDVDCRIIDLKTEEPLLPGDVGELIVKGPQVMKGYWNQPEETEATLKGGWLHTGDIARMDPDGYFYIVDRKKEMIKVSGFNVYPREVEEVLYQNPSVKEAAVIGVKDQYQGESVKAFVILKDGVKSTKDEIIAWSRERLAGYKVPKDVEFVTQLPKSLIGKVLRRVLAEQENAQQATVKKN